MLIYDLPETFSTIATAKNVPVMGVRDSAESVDVQLRCGQVEEGVLCYLALEM